MSQNVRKKTECEAAFRHKRLLHQLYVEKRQRIDELGARAFSENLAVGQRLQAYNELMDLLVRPLEPKQGTDEFASTSIEQERRNQIIVAMGVFLDTKVPNYLSGRSFYQYLLNSLPFILIDIYREDNGLRPLTKKEREILEAELQQKELMPEEKQSPPKPKKKVYGTMTVSVNALLDSENSGSAEFGDFLGREDDHSDLFCEEIIVLTLTALLGIHRRLKDKANNAVRINYFRLFYSEGVIHAVHNISEVLPLYQRHEREVLRQLKPLLLKYCLALEFPDPPMDECFMPLTDDYCRIIDLVYAKAKREVPLTQNDMIDYLQTAEGQHSTKQLITNNREFYRQYLRENGLLEYQPILSDEKDKAKRSTGKTSAKKRRRKSRDNTVSTESSD